MRLFRKSRRENLATTMAGVKLGDRVLVAGCSDPRLIASLAIKSGLTGRACAIDASADRANEAARVAHAEGALIETAAAPLAAMPYADASFDIVVLRDVIDESSSPHAGVAREAARVLRPGGRCIAILTTGGGALSRLLVGAASPQDAAERGQAFLKAAEFRGVRTLAQREGLTFVEGMKPASG